MGGYFFVLELQGKLSDYNLVVDKLNTGTERGEILAEARDLNAANKAEAIALEALFAERTRRQNQISQLEKEIQKVILFYKSINKILNWCYIFLFQMIPTII